MLDTSVILIALEDPAMLSDAVQRAVLEGPNFLSVVSYWEAMLKSMKGNLQIGNERIWWQDVLFELAGVTLPLIPAHIESLRNLPFIHKDPFDWILIAQATAEDLTLVTTDAAIASYASAQFRVIV